MKRNCYIFSDTIVKRRNNSICIQTVKQVGNPAADQDILSGMRNNYYEVLDSRIYPIENINAVYSYGSINFNSKLLALIGKHGIPMHIFNQEGSYRGTFYPSSHLDSVNILLKQAKVVSDSNVKNRISKKIITAYLLNTLMNLKYHNSRGSNLRDHISLLMDTRESLKYVSDEDSIHEIYLKIRHVQEETWEEIILVEKCYFEYVLKEILTALKNFANMMMNSVCLTEIYRSGLDQRISFLKSSRNLAEDIKIIFEPIVSDRLIFRLLQHRMITSCDFQKFSNIMAMKEDARKLFIKEFDMRLFVAKYDKSLNIHLPVATIIAKEFEKLKKFIIEEEDYEPYTITEN
ncbi:MAG: CRISPR-associated endonuclease Cas1 [Ignavibacteria bacterium]|nr:CRISPR-associated endonuclease Cas1 [Ignavibacteria bacterium]